MWSSHLIREGGQGEKERSWLNNREIGADNGGELATDKTLEQLWAEKWTWIWTGSWQLCSFVMDRLKFWEWSEVISAARIRLWGKEVDEGTARFYAFSSTDFIIPVKDVKVILVKHFLFSYNSLFLLLIFLSKLWMRWQCKCWQVRGHANNHSSSEGRDNYVQLFFGSFQSSCVHCKPFWLHNLHFTRPLQVSAPLTSNGPKTRCWIINFLQQKISKNYEKTQHSNPIIQQLDLNDASKESI